MDVDSVMVAPAWTTGMGSISTSAGSIPARAWRMPLSRHLKLVSSVGGGEGHAGRAGMSWRSKVEQQQEGQEHAEGSLHPLHVAASQGILKVGRALLEGQAVDATVRDGFGRSPLHWAAMTNRVEFMQLLLRNGAEVDAVDRASRTPLMSCAAFGASGAARLLLQSGADKDSKCVRGLTPLHAAASGGHVEVIEILIAAGADTLKQATVGATPRHLAERHGHDAVVEVLAAHGGRRPSFGGDGGGQVKALAAQHKLERHILLQRTLSMRR